MNKREKIRQIAGVAVLTALAVILVFLSTPIQFTIGTPINLSLIVVALVAIIYGPVAGFLVGFICGGFFLFSSSVYFAISIPGTILICTLKEGVAGLIAGYIFKALSKKNEIIASIIAALVVPIINTTVYIIGSLIFFKGVFGELINAFIAINFILEFSLTIVLTPTILKVVKIVKKK